MSFSLLKRGVTSVAAIVVDLATNASRILASHTDLLTVTRTDKDGNTKQVIDPQLVKLTKSLNEHGYDSGFAGDIILVKTTKAKAKAAQSGLVKAFNSLDLGKEFPIPGGHLKGTDVGIWLLSQKDDATGESLSGSRRTAAGAMVEAWREKRNEAALGKVPYQLRSYDDPTEQLKDCVRLNESQKEGVRATSPKEKMVAMFNLQESGLTVRSEMRKQFPSLPAGQFQQGYEHIFFDRYLRLVNVDLADEFKVWCIDTSKACMSQPFVTEHRALRLKAEYAEGATNVKTAFLGKGKIAEFSRVKDNIEQHPELLDGLIELVKGLISTGNQSIAPRAKAMKRDTITQKAAMAGGVSEQLMMGIANDNATEIQKALNKIARLVEPVFLRNDAGEFIDVPLDQKGLDDLAGYKTAKKKKASGRQRKKTG